MSMLAEHTQQHIRTRCMKRLNEEYILYFRRYSFVLVHVLYVYSAFTMLEIYSSNHIITLFLHILSLRSKSWAAADINKRQKFKLCLRYLLLPMLNISMMLLSSILMENCLMIFFLHIIFFNIRFFHLHFFSSFCIGLAFVGLCCLSFCRFSSFSF